MTAPTAHDLAEQMRNAAAWFRLAADRLDEGKVTDARNMVALGATLTEPLPHRLAELALTEPRTSV